MCKNKKILKLTIFTLLADTANSFYTEFTAKAKQLFKIYQSHAYHRVNNINLTQIYKTVSNSWQTGQSIPTKQSEVIKLLFYMVEWSFPALSEKDIGARHHAADVTHPKEFLYLKNRQPLPLLFNRKGSIRIIDDGYATALSRTLPLLRDTDTRTFCA